MRFVIRIGGSVIASPPNPVLVKRYAKVIQSLRSQRHEIVVVVGGGAPARQFIKLAKETGLGELEQDEVAISVSRLFAQLLSMKLGDLGSTTVPVSIEQAIRSLKRGEIPVMGGLNSKTLSDIVLGRLFISFCFLSKNS